MQKNLAYLGHIFTSQSTKIALNHCKKIKLMQKPSVLIPSVAVVLSSRAIQICENLTWELRGQ